jgi:hypothetical protein
MSRTTCEWKNVTPPWQHKITNLNTYRYSKKEELGRERKQGGKDKESRRSEQKVIGVLERALHVAADIAIIQSETRKLCRDLSLL